MPAFAATNALCSRIAARPTTEAMLTILPPPCSSIGIRATRDIVKPSSPAATAGLRPDDWIKEIDGVEVRSFADATEKLGAIDGDAARPEVVLLVSRGGETAVLRVKLK